jgi:hypothetical protein
MPPAEYDPAMPEAVSPLTLEFLNWVSSRPRTYAEAMEAWRSNCPRHPVWDDALNDGLIQIVNRGAAKRANVILTPRGKAILDRN